MIDQQTAKVVCSVDYVFWAIRAPTCSKSSRHYSRPDASLVTYSLRSERLRGSSFFLKCLYKVGIWFLPFWCHSNRYCAPMLQPLCMQMLQHLTRSAIIPTTHSTYLVPHLFASCILPVWHILCMYDAVISHGCAEATTVRDHIHPIHSKWLFRSMLPTPTVCSSSLFFNTDNIFIYNMFLL